MDAVSTTVVRGAASLDFRKKVIVEIGLYVYQAHRRRGISQYSKLFRVCFIICTPCSASSDHSNAKNIVNKKS